MKKSNYNLEKAEWVDATTLMGITVLPDRVPDIPSIEYSSLVNLLNCPIGARGRIFLPTYGTMLHYYLQEPIDATTANLIRINLIQAIEKWEPRIELMHEFTSVTPDFTIPGYKISIAYRIRLTGAHSTASFNVSQNQGIDNAR